MSSVSHNLANPAFIDPSLDSRAVTFENPTGGRGAGGTAHGGRKGAPNMRMRAGESVVLADLDGPGTIRHIWMTIPPAPPELMRSLWIEVFYDGLEEPSVSVPFVDFFGLPHGRPVEYHSALTAVQEGRGFNSYVPMPFGEHVRIVATNGGSRSIILYYQVDYTLSPLDEGAGYLHVGFRRENPTVQKRDFVIVDGLEGPGSVPRVRDRRARHRRGRLVRRGRGEGVPRRRRRPPDDLRHRPRGLRRQRVGDGRAQRSVRRRAARDR